MTATTQRRSRASSGPLVIRNSHGRPALKRNQRSPLLTALSSLMLIYTLLPLVWLVIAATKTQEGLFRSFGLWFDRDFDLFGNIATTFTYDGGIFIRWFLNTLFYVVVGAGGATMLATLAGYGLAKFDFPGKKVVFAIVIGAVAVPTTALAVPQFLMFASLHLTNTPWAVIVPSLICPFGLYLMWTYAADAVPKEIIESARVDGAREFQTFFRVSLPLLAPGIVTTFLFTFVQTLNNYFLPLIMLKDPDWYPLTVGLKSWNAQASTVGGEAIFNLVITGSLLTIVPLVVAFLLLQRYWQSGLAAGSVKE